jgi:hypothetical protein
MTGVAPAEVVTIPASHRDLLERPICGVMTTLLPDGQPHSCLVWVDHDGTHACVNTTLQRQGGRDLLADARLNLLVVDPEDTGRYPIRVRQTVAMERSSTRHTRRYTRHPRYYCPCPPTRRHGAAGHRGHPRAPGHARRHPRLTVAPGVSRTRRRSAAPLRRCRAAISCAPGWRVTGGATHGDRRPRGVWRG